MVGGRQMEGDGLQLGRGWERFLAAGRIGVTADIALEDGMCEAVPPARLRFGLACLDLWHLQHGSAYSGDETS